MYSMKHRYVFDVVRAVVPKIDLDNVFIAKEEIAQDVQATLTKVRCVGASHCQVLLQHSMAAQ